jgi:asparagine synthase (glutamine-hydrolysing)
MCGFVVVLGEMAQEAAERTAELSRSIRHRGPDDEGVFLADGVLMVQNRLAVVRPEARPALPWKGRRGQLAYNGEIYNHHELAAKLSTPPPREQNDGGVLAALLDERGEAALRDLVGMFAFVFVDPGTGDCLAAVDSFRIKPLYYAQRGDGLVLASELGAMRTALGRTPELDLDALVTYVGIGTIPVPWTVYRGVRALPAGHRLRWRGGVLDVRPYALPPGQPPARRDAAEPAAVHSALAESVRRQLPEDVDCGVLLSGGLDSTTVAALAGLAHRRPLTAFTFRSDDPRLDESEPARRAAQALGLPIRTVSLGGVSLTELLVDFVEVIDQPTCDGLNTFLLARGVAPHLKVCLAGHGGDEWFGGYGTFELAAEPLPEGGKDRRRFIQRFLDTKYSAREFYWGDAAAHEEILGPALRRRLPEARSRLVDLVAARTKDLVGDSGDWLTAAELGLYMQDRVLRDVDVCSMAFGLEVRVPLLDQRVARTLAPTPSHRRFGRPGSKQLLRSSVGGLLPPEVLRRPKRGFEVPLWAWLLAARPALVRAVLLSAAERGLLASDRLRRPLRPPAVPAMREDWAFRIWTLVLLELWLRIVIDGDRRFAERMRRLELRPWKP